MGAWASAVRLCIVRRLVIRVTSSRHCRRVLHLRVRPDDGSGLLGARAGCLGSGPPITSWAGGRGRRASAAWRTGRVDLGSRRRGQRAQLGRPRGLGRPPRARRRERRRGRRWRRRRAPSAESLRVEYPAAARRVAEITTTTTRRESASKLRGEPPPLGRACPLNWP